MESTKQSENDNRRAFQAWAPQDGAWSAWCKPALFVVPPADAVDEDRGSGDKIDLHWAPPADQGVGLVLDVPGHLAIDAGVELASRGYCPVPLFNGLPGPSAVVPTLEMQRRLLAAVPVLEQIGRMRGTNGPPAFLLDSRRLGEARRIEVGMFDNRWLLFPQDVPSGERLRKEGVLEVIVLTNNRRGPECDLARICSSWDQCGVNVSVRMFADPNVTRRWAIVRHWNWIEEIRWLLLRARLCRSGTGAFGRVVRMTVRAG